MRPVDRRIQADAGDPFPQLQANAYAPDLLEHDSDQRRAEVSHHSAHSGALLAAPAGRVSSLGTGSHRPLGATLMCCRSPAGSDPCFHYYELSFRSSGSTLIVEEEEDQAEVGQRGDPRSVLELHV